MEFEQESLDSSEKNYKHNANTPHLKSRTFFSKCGKYFIHQTTITTILPMPYFVKIIDSKLNQETSNQDNISNL